MMSTVGAAGFIAASAFAATYKYANILDGFFAPKYSRDGIDKLLDEIRKECRTHGLTDYACRNIRNLLDNTLKKIKLSEN